MEDKMNNNEKSANSLCPVCNKIFYYNVLYPTSYCPHCGTYWGENFLVDVDINDNNLIFFLPFFRYSPVSGRKLIRLYDNPQNTNDEIDTFIINYAADIDLEILLTWGISANDYIDKEKLLSELIRIASKN